MMVKERLWPPRGPRNAAVALAISFLPVLAFIQKEVEMTIGTPTQITLARKGGQVPIPFDVHEPNSLPDYIGIYAVIRVLENGNFVPIYIGRTDDQTIAERFESHHKMDCFKEHAWTHVACREYTDAKDREAMEGMLISEQHPPCND